MKEYFYSASYASYEGAFSFSGVISAENGFDAYNQVEIIIEHEMEKSLMVGVFEESSVHVSCLNLV